MRKAMDRFHAMVMPEPNTGCWLWAGSTNERGYGLFRLHSDQTMKATHRVSYEMNIGEIPKNAHVLHTCDTPCCVNPQHLYLGTHRSNMADKVRKRRSPDFRGEKHPKVKITEGDVAIIRAWSGPIKDLATRFGLNQRYISNIRNRRTWKHV